MCIRDSFCHLAALALLVAATAAQSTPLTQLAALVGCIGAAAWVVFFAGLLRRDLADRPEAQRQVDCILRGVEAANRIVSDLLEYCRPIAPARAMVALDGRVAESLAGRVQPLLHCGTIWVHGHTVAAPTTEERPRRPFGSYGEQKAAIEAYGVEPFVQKCIESVFRYTSEWEHLTERVGF